MESSNVNIKQTVGYAGRDHHYYWYGNRWGLFTTGANCVGIMGAGIILHHLSDC